jgi:hypothetical protein
MGRGYASYQQSTPTWVLTTQQYIELPMKLCLISAIHPYVSVNSQQYIELPMKLATSVPVPKDNYQWSRCLYILDIFMEANFMG